MSWWRVGHDCGGKTKTMQPTCHPQQDMPAITTFKSCHSLLWQSPGLLPTGKGAKDTFWIDCKTVGSNPTVEVPGWLQMEGQHVLSRIYLLEDWWVERTSPLQWRWRSHVCSDPVHDVTGARKAVMPQWLFLPCGKEWLQKEVHKRDTISNSSRYKKKDHRWPLLGSLRWHRHRLYSFQQDVRSRGQKQYLFSELNSWNWPKEKKEPFWQTRRSKWNNNNTLLQQLPSHRTIGQSSHILYHGQPRRSEEIALTKQSRQLSHGRPDLEQKRNVLFISSKIWLAGVCFKRKYFCFWRRHIIKIIVQKKDIKHKIIWTIFGNNREVKQNLENKINCLLLSELQMVSPIHGCARSRRPASEENTSAGSLSSLVRIQSDWKFNLFNYYYNPI